MFLDNVYRAWGPVDIVIGTISGRPFDDGGARRVLEDEQVGLLSDGASVRVQLIASVEAEQTGRRETTVNLIAVDPELDRSLGDFVVAGGGEAVAAEGDSVIINERLAGRLSVEKGDVLIFVTRGVDGRPLIAHFAVAAIVENEGKANWNLRPNAFVTLETLRRVAGGGGLVNQIVLSAGGPDRAPRQVKELEEFGLGAVHREIPPAADEDPEGRRFRVAAAKSHSIALTKEQSRFIRGILGGLGALVALTSVALIVNLFVILGEERRSELGIMRALGLKRLGLVALGLVEGFLYAGTAAAVGALVGGLFGGWIARAMIDLFATFAREAAVEFTTPPFEIQASTLLLAAGGGFLVAAISVLFVVVRTSRLSVVSAIRGLPEERTERRRRPLLHLGAVGLGASLLVSGAVSDVSPAILAGGAIGLIGAAGLLVRVAGRRAASSVGAVAVGLWGLWVYVYLPDFAGEIETAFGLTVGAAVLIVLSGVVLVSANLNVLERPAALFGARLRAVVRAATAYPVGFRFRTAMSMAMFALVLYMVGAFAIWGGLAGGDFERESGGFQVMARSTLPIDELRVEGASQVAGLHSTRYEHGYKIRDQSVGFPVQMFGVDAALASAAEFMFTERLEGLDDGEVWERLASSSDGIVLDVGTNPGTARPGDVVELHTQKGKRGFTIIGIVDEFWLEALFVSKQTFADIYPTRAGDTAWLIRLEEGRAPTEVVGALKRDNRGIGLDAMEVRDIFEESAEGQRTFVGLFQMLLKLALLIGVSGIAIGSVRAVLERRQAVGVMRALGFKRSMVAAWLLLESLLVTTIGCAIGLCAGLVATYLLLLKQFPNLGFRPDWGQIGSALLLVYLAVIAFTVVPVWRAARILPAEAIRYVE